MKKVLSLLFSMVIILFTCIVYASDIDLRKYSNDEIQELYEIVKNEMADRGLSKEVKVPQGYYFTGQDIPAGKYVIRKADKDSMLVIQVYSAPDDSNTLNRVSYDLITYDENKEQVVTLSDGMVLDLEYSEAYMRKFEGIQFE